MQTFENDYYFFGFFVLPFFQKKHKIKTKSGSKRLFFNNDGKYKKHKIKKKALHELTFILGGMKGFFF